MPAAVSIRPLEPRDIPQCEEIFRGLPQWFGFADVNAQYVRDLASLPSFVALEGSEVHVLAVRRSQHRSGIGRALVRHSEADLARNGVKLLQVKTLGPSNPDAGYRSTRAFYSALGFIPLEETTALWGETQPCLIMVKPLPGG